MNQPRLNVEISLPHSWRLLDRPMASMARGNQLLLQTLNAMESVSLESSPDRTHERLEAKLDLALHWLGRVLHAGSPVPDARALRLDGEAVAWVETTAAPPSGSQLCVTLYPSALVAAPLELETRVEGLDGPWLRTRLMDDSQEFVDAWTQWLFRLHRRTIQAARR